MKACGDAGRWKEALTLMDDMRQDGTPPMETTYTTAVSRVVTNTAASPLCCRAIPFYVSFCAYREVGVCCFDGEFALASRLPGLT